MRRTLTCFICLPGLLLTAVVATAADLPAVEKRYEVELIVFRHADQSRNTAEIPAASSIFSPSPLNLILQRPVTQPPQLLAAPAERTDIVSSDRMRRPPITFLIMELDSTYPDFVPLTADAQSLDRIYQRLQRIDAYEPILHIGWVQPAHSSDSAEPYRFAPATVGEIGIVGTVTLYKERFLHIQVDLALEAEPSATADRYLFPVEPVDAPDEYTLMESRRIRGSTVHYFDHPRFGVITRVQELQAAITEREESG